MFVSEQPTPRGQVAYRDGTHHFVCSLDELRAVVQHPNPLGDPVAVYVEALPTDFTLASTSTDRLPWIPAEEAHFVFGASRPLVMGLPALSFSTAEEARRHALPMGTTPVRWYDMLNTPFGTPPPEAAVR